MPGSSRRRLRRRHRPMVDKRGRNDRLYVENGPGATFVVTRTDAYSAEKRKLLNSMAYEKAADIE